MYLQIRVTKNIICSGAGSFVHRFSTPEIKKKVYICMTWHVSFKIQCLEAVEVRWSIEKSLHLELENESPENY